MSDFDHKLRNWFAANGELSRADAGAVFCVQHNTAGVYLSILTSKKLLERTGHGRYVPGPAFHEGRITLTPSRKEGGPPFEPKPTSRATPAVGVDPVQLLTGERVRLLKLKKEAEHNCTTYTNQIEKIEKALDALQG